MSKEEKAEALSLYEQMGGTYTEIDGIFYPNITIGDEITEQNDFCGKYGDMWKKHMHDNRNADYRHYLFTGRLNEKAKEINEQAYKMLDVIMNQYMNNRIFKSKNQFFIDAATYYIEHYGCEALTESKEKKEPQFISTEEMAAIEERIRQKAREEARQEANKEVMNMVGSLLAAMQANNGRMPMIQQQSDTDDNVDSDDETYDDVIVQRALDWMEKD